MHTEGKTNEPMRATQNDADRLREQARIIEAKSMRVSGEAGTRLDKEARALRKRAQEIEEWLPS